MKKPIKFIKLLYVGETDENGLPHGEESCAMWWNLIWRKRLKTPFIKARATCAIKGISNMDCDMGKATYTSWD